jgi:prepilin-type N-terminal cleavage/methylation domain-containing protein/prepilin-type processing-associated H-X9-DG protein
MRRVVPSGFTLVELLVVIAILGILASILMPVFTHARGKARQASCTSNLHQIGIALHMYADDHDEMFPLDASSGPSSFWYERLDPYIKNSQIGICPQQLTQPRTMPGFDHPYAWTYAMNRAICRLDMQSAGEAAFFDLARIQTSFDVSRMLMVTETVADGAAPDFFVMRWWQQPQYHIFPHDNMAEVLFVDGHVKPYGAGAPFDSYPGLLAQ